MDTFTFIYEVSMKLQEIYPARLELLGRESQGLAYTVFGISPYIWQLLRALIAKA